MSIDKLQVRPRSERGSNAMKNLRAEGFVPGVLYGLKQEPRLLKIKAHDMAAFVREGTRTVELTLDGRVQAALLKDIQYDHLGDHLLHADFVRVDLAKTLTLHVPLRFIGVAKGQAAGGRVEHRLSELEVRCLPERIPEEVTVSLADLDVGQSLAVKDLALPDGVTSPLDPETVVVAVSVGAEEEEEAAAPAEAAAAAEPEVIARRDRPEEAKKEGDA